MLQRVPFLGKRMGLPMLLPVTFAGNSALARFFLSAQLANTPQGFHRRRGNESRSYLSKRT